MACLIRTPSGNNSAVLSLPSPPAVPLLLKPAGQGRLRSLPDSSEDSRPHTAEKSHQEESELSEIRGSYLSDNGTVTLDQASASGPESAISGTAAMVALRQGQPVPKTSPGTACRNPSSGMVSGTIGAIISCPYGNRTRPGPYQYRKRQLRASVRVSARHTRQRAGRPSAIMAL